MSLGRVQIATSVVIVLALVPAAKIKLLVLAINPVIFAGRLSGPARILQERKVEPHIVFLDAGLKVTHELGRRVLTTVFLQLCMSLGFLLLIILNGLGISLTLLPQVTKACLALDCRVILA